MMKLSVVIPAYNEAQNLPKTVEAIYCELTKEDIEHEILVSNDNSEDNTQEVIDALEKMKASIKDIDTNIKMIDVLLSSINTSIDELPMELQESIMTLIKQRQELVCHRIEGLRLIKLTEELIGE